MNSVRKIGRPRQRKEVIEVMKRKDALCLSLSSTHPNVPKSHFILPSGPAYVCVRTSSHWVPLVDSGCVKDLPLEHLQKSRRCSLLYHPLLNTTN